MRKRVFLIVLDSFGIGGAPDAAAFGDEGSNTLATIAAHPAFACPNLQKLGLFNIDGVDCGMPAAAPAAAFARLREASNGKDTTIGHWEIAGVESPRPLPTFPEGFPAELIERFEQMTGRRVLCNLPYSGTQVLDDYGEQHMATGDLIVYTSADSVFQIAAHEEIIPVEELYRICEQARELLTGEWAVGRVIARPFVGEKAGAFSRTANRHDFSIKPPQKTMLDHLQAAGKATIGVGKIYDIFGGVGVSESTRNKSNHHGMETTLAYAKKDFEGLCFVNLVDFDSAYGHRNNIAGYAAAATEFDTQLGQLLPLLQPEDLLIITADHGCDPGTPSTDHSRECVPALFYGESIRPGTNLGERLSFAHIAATVLDYLEVAGKVCGTSLLPEMKQ